ncbi:hypothetical protein SS50377_23504 [Spironucleus salmonicida]|uniref:Uncharacterized protein n=1 Tax=Spironucleus salmonicida TaxID=348837 RepID=V6LNJ3_9EUKA|nr:hypothetical protein SS50377_23504 [Spironucleus salmonicida]|eukprot:EST46242.1 Hypothetical protein SS50377_13838 [Spironucleus salmonicida]
MDFIFDILGQDIVDLPASRALHFQEITPKYNFYSIEEANLHCFTKQITQLREVYTSKHDILLYQAAQLDISIFAFLISAQQDTSQFQKLFVKLLVLIHLQIKDISEYLHQQVNFLSNDSFKDLTFYLLNDPNYNVDNQSIKQLMSFKKYFKTLNSQILFFYQQAECQPIKSDFVQSLESGILKDLRASISAIIISQEAGLQQGMKMIFNINNYDLKLAILGEILFRFQQKEKLQLLNDIFDQKLTGLDSDYQDLEFFLPFINKESMYNLSPTRHVKETLKLYLQNILQIDEFALPFSQFIFAVFPETFQ